jgi:extracellular elastinolytic metalloproteinase
MRRVLVLVPLLWVTTPWTGAPVGLHDGAGPQTVQAETAVARALEYLRAQGEDPGTTARDVADVVVTSQHVSEHTGVRHIYLRQRYHGIEVYGADMNMNIARDGRVIGVGHALVPNLARAVNHPARRCTAIEAVEAAAKHLGLNVTLPLAVLKPAKGPQSETEISDGGISSRPIPARLVYHPTEDRGVRLAWVLDIELPSGDHWWEVVVDAETRTVLKTFDRVLNQDVQVRCGRPQASPGGG